MRCESKIKNLLLGVGGWGGLPHALCGGNQTLSTEVNGRLKET